MPKIEIVLFGKGTGESILINCGDNEWIVVDCCIEPESNLPAPIAYFNDLGLDYKNLIKKVVISHFHDDHIRGMGVLIEGIPNAEIYISDALSLHESAAFFAFHEQHKNSIKNESGISEFLKILNILSSRNKSFEHVKANTLIHQTRGSIIQLFTMSPSDSDCQVTKQKFITLVKESEKGKMPAVPRDFSNAHCVTLVLSTSNTDCPYNDIVFGSDLEVDLKTGGWDAAINSRVAPQNTAKVFKISHHGSVTGYHQPTWNKCFTANPIGILTTFNKGRRPLPDIDLVTAYSKLTEKLYSTTTPKCFLSKKVSREQRKINDIIEKHARSVKILNSTTKSFGSIHLSKDMTVPDEYQIILKGNARCLKALLIAS